MDKVILKRGLIVLLIVVVVLSVWGVQWKTLESNVTSGEDLQPGDMLFVDIYEGWSHGGFWDHMALYVGEQPYIGPAVVEATFNGGILLTQVDAFIKRDKPAKVAARRLTGDYRDEEVIQQAIDYAVAQVGKPFDYTAHTTTVPHKFMESHLHCSEVVWRAYKAAGIDIDCNDGLCVYPDDIYFSSKLEPI